MPVTINGNGSITGLAQGGIDGTKVVTSAAQPAGSIIQVQSGHQNQPVQLGSTTFTDITGMTVTLTNVQSGSKVYIVTNMHMSTADAGLAFRLFRGSTELCQPST